MAVLKIDGVDGDLHEYKAIYTAVANGAITAGQVVEVETDPTASPDPDDHGYNGQVVKACGTTSSPLACGVALTTVADGEKVQVVYAGLVDCVNKTGPTAAENIALGEKVSASTSGQIRQYDTDSATTAALGVCVDAFTSGNSDGKFLMYDKGWLS
jgi:hypothetical protein